jgi:hypothetical protein
MLLITSAAYLDPEFTAEFGRLPPAFLPVGNRRLWEWQVDNVTGWDGPVVLSLPEDFAIDAADQATLEARGVEVARVPPGLSLGASVIYCINLRRAHQTPLRILHGDTLIPGLDAGESDAVGVASTSEYYAWAEVEGDGEGVRFVEGLPSGRAPRDILCGWFALADPSLLIQSITRAGGGFVKGLNLYAEERPLRRQAMPEWYDFGHVHLYYQSKSRMTTQRAFNNLTATARSVLKSSADAAKIDAEARWYIDLPPALSVFTPKFLGRETDEKGRPGYRIEYLYLSTLSELFVFGRLPTFTWSRIFGKAAEFLTLAARERGEDGRVRTRDYLAKTLERLERFARERDVDLDAPTRLGGKPLPSLRAVAERTADLIPDATLENTGRWHGDFCFSNIFFDFRADQVRTIDPRGLAFDGRPSPLGDMRYDAAKLAHSVIGRYDFIIAGRHALVRHAALDFDLDLPDDRSLAEVEQEFRRQTFVGRRGDDPAILALMVQLFLSMLPLHADHPDRQLALLADGLRLFSALDGEG